MRLAILSRGPGLYSTRRLVDEGRAAGATVAVLDPLQFSLGIGTDSVEILHEGQSVEFDAVLPRIGYSITRHGVAVLRQFEQLSVFTANSSRSVIRSRDKLHANQLLARSKVPMPVTTYVKDRRDVDQAVMRVGGTPVVVKVSEGTQGHGVTLCKNIREVKRIVDLLLSAGNNVLIQQYIKESHGTDIRVLVVGDEVVASMRRRSKGGEFRSNFHLNGSVEGINIPQEYQRVARRAARLLGLNIAGVDLLEGPNGPLLLEVNSSPGLEGIEKASRINVAERIISWVMENSDFTEVRLEQMLRTKRGHGVLSIHLTRHPWLVGKKLGELFGPSESDGGVFALARDGAHLWMPGSDTLLESNDELVCYGRLKELRPHLRELLTPPAEIKENELHEVYQTPNRGF